MVNMQARILEKQEAVQERKARKKVPFSFLSCNLFNSSNFNLTFLLVNYWGSGKNIRDTRGSSGD